MIQMRADGGIVYDSRLSDQALLAFTVTTGVNKGGTAEFTMPPGHPAYSKFVNYRTIVEIYRGGALLFRGRVLYPTDDFYRRRAITCEGERCFLKDAVMRPYLYQDSPAAIFSDVIGQYNAQVEAVKQFRVGTVSVVDSNDYVRLESESAVQVADTIDKLVERCGGYITFTTAADGVREINWLESLGQKSDQVIEFGENLLDLTRTQSSTDLATRIIPYGAKDEGTGTRITITAINDGLDFIEDPEATALRGVIAKPVFWNDVTEPENLLKKAKQYLATSKMVVTSLQLSAVDLSIVDGSIDAFEVGDLVRVRSKPHGLDETFMIQERTYNLLDPGMDTITLGKDLATLTGADVAGDRESASKLEKTEHDIRADYQIGISKAVEEAEKSLSAMIEQTASSIIAQVAEKYATNNAVTGAISTTLKQLSDQFTMEFERLSQTVTENGAAVEGQFETLYSYIRFKDGNIILGRGEDALTLTLKNNVIVFQDNGADVAYLTDKKLYVTDGEFLNSLRIGKFAFAPRENGNLSLVKVGG